MPRGKVRAPKITTVYKVLDGFGRSTYQRYQWPIPVDDTPTEWLSASGIVKSPILCEFGFHGWNTLEIARRNVGLRGHIYLMELEGEVVSDFEKTAGLRARLIREVPAEADDGISWTEIENTHATAGEIVKEARRIRKEMTAAHVGTGTYMPVVPAAHSTKLTRKWKVNRCGTCGLGDGMHEDFEARSAFYDKFGNMDRWELLLFLYETVVKGKPSGIGGV